MCVDVGLDQTVCVLLLIFGEGEALVCLGCNRFIYHSHAGAHAGAHAEKSGAC